MAGDRVITMGTLGAKQEATNKDLADKIALRTGWVADGDATPTTGDLGTDGTDVDVVNPAVKLKFFGGGAKVYDLGNQTAGINISGAGEGPWVAATAGSCWVPFTLTVSGLAGDMWIIWRGVTFDTEGSAIVPQDLEITSGPGQWLPYFGDALYFDGGYRAVLVFTDDGDVVLVSAGTLLMHRSSGVMTATNGSPNVSRDGIVT
jgi:hypothetical protein